jgi:hypothetical protein
MRNIKKFWKLIVISGAILTVIVGILSNGKELYGFVTDTYPMFEKNFRLEKYKSKKYQAEYAKLAKLNIGLQRNYIEKLLDTTPKFIANYNPGICKEYEYEKNFFDTNDNFVGKYTIQLTVDSEDNIIRYGIWTHDQSFKPSFYSGLTLNESNLDYMAFGGGISPTYITPTRQLYYHEKIDLQGPGRSKTIYLLGSPEFNYLNQSSENELFESRESEEKNLQNDNIRIKNFKKYNEVRKATLVNGFALEVPEMGDCRYEFRFSSYVDFNRT